MHLIHVLQGIGMAIYKGGGGIQERHMAYIFAFKDGLDPPPPPPPPSPPSPAIYGNNMYILGQLSNTILVTGEIAGMCRLNAESCRVAMLSHFSEEHI